MRILLTNDDGIMAEGLQALHRALSEGHRVTVVAPDRERSAVGHGITLHKPLRATTVSNGNGYGGHAVSGTPVDCIKLGLHEILENRPDMVISGINPGANVGVNLNYSGTVCAAKEATLYGIPAIAVSMPGPHTRHFDEAAGFVRTLAEQVHRKGLPAGRFLNVNIPDRPLSDIAGIRISRQGMAFFEEFFDRRTDPRDRTYYWQGCDAATRSRDPEVDETALAADFISITPVCCDPTDYALMAELKDWSFELG